MSINETHGVLLGGIQGGWFTGINHVARATAWLHGIATWYAVNGAALFVLVMVGAWVLAHRIGDPRRVALALWSPAAVVLALGFDRGFLAYLGEPLPHSVFPHSLVLVSGGSIPVMASDTTIVAGALSTVVFLIHRRFGAFVAGLALLLAFTRTYVGARWPLDELIVLVIGAAIAYSSVIAGQWPLQWLTKVLSVGRDHQLKDDVDDTGERDQIPRAA